MISRYATYRLAVTKVEEDGRAVEIEVELEGHGAGEGKLSMDDLTLALLNELTPERQVAVMERLKAKQEARRR